MMRSTRAKTIGAALAAALAGGCSTHTLRAGSPTRSAGHEIVVGCPDCDRCGRSGCGCAGCEQRQARNRRNDGDCGAGWRGGAPIPAGTRWDVVLPPPEVARFERRYDRGWLPETWRNDERLSPRDDRPIDAVSGSWPEPWRPDLDFDRTGRTSVQPERFIYSSRLPYTRYRAWRWRGWYRR